jgi:diguanylate cyclase (GGDEF)-like protein/PAS domain S-box-containing protein
MNFAGDSEAGDQATPWRPIAWPLALLAGLAVAIAAYIFASARVAAVYFFAILGLLLAFVGWLMARRRLEADLRRAYLEADDLYQNAPCGYHSLDADGRFVRINDTELRMLGYRREEIIGKRRIQELMSPGSLADFARNYPRLKELGQISAVEVEFIRKDGSFLPALVNATAIRDRQGRFLRSRSTIFDLTELKQAQVALNESEMIYRSVVAAMAEGVVIQAADGRVIAFNAAAERIAGHRARDMAAHTAEDPMRVAVHEDGTPFPGDEHPSMVTLRTGRAQSKVIMGIRRPDGELRWLSVNSQPVRRSEDIPPHAVVTTFHDITERKLAQDAQQRLLQEKNAILDSALVGIVFVKNREIVTCNRRFEEVFGYVPGEMVGKSTRVLYATDDDFEEIGRRAYASSDDAQPFSREVRLRRRDGSEFWGAMTGRALDPALPHEGSIWIYADISVRRAAEVALRESQAKFSAMFNLTPDPLSLTRLRDGILLEVSRSWADFFGYEPAEVLGHSTLPGGLSIWLHADNRRRWLAALERSGEVRGFETQLRRKDGSVVSVLVSAKLIDFNGERCALVDVHDISEQKQHEAELKEIAHHDPLTKLPNRLLLADRLHQAIGQSRRLGTRVAICYLDLDGFKAINDSLGHAMGDRLLIEVSDRLGATVRGGDTVARLGGDEFVLLLAGLGDDEECRNALERLLAIVSAPYGIAGDRELVISASIGVTVFPDDADDPDTLIRHADHAMYAAKQAGKNRFQFFDTPLERAIEARQAARQRIEAALTAGQFRLYYQPKVDCRRGCVVGAEALIRWQHPTLGLLAPSEFLPVIEDDPLAIAVGDWVIGETLRQMAAWRHQGMEIRISVNAFARQLLQPGFAEGLRLHLARQPEVDPRQVQIEIVESTAVDKLDAVRSVIEACAAFGIEFALDDFGTGYSSLVYLRHLPAHELKIDQSFVRNMLQDDNDLTIVEAVIGLGRAFHLSVIAEGVETEDHVNRLIELGCDVMQGYALARPMPADELMRWVGNYQSRRQPGK